MLSMLFIIEPRYMLNKRALMLSQLIYSFQEVESQVNRI